MNTTDFTFEITSQDIQPKNVRAITNPNNDNKIRRAWVMQTPDSIAEQFKKLPQEVKFELYQSIDKEISDEWIRLMKEYVNSNSEHFITDKSGAERLADHLCVNADDQLIVAALNIVKTFKV